MKSTAVAKKKKYMDEESIHTSWAEVLVIGLRKASRPMVFPVFWYPTRSHVLHLHDVVQYIIILLYIISVQSTKSLIVGDRDCFSKAPVLSRRESIQISDLISLQLGVQSFTYMN